MPGYSSYDNALATKLVEFYPENTQGPTHQGQVLLFDPTNGNLQAVSKTPMLQKPKSFNL